jgi:hypothetical protein
MVHLTWDTLRKLIHAGAVFVLLTGTASAQFAPSMTLSPESSRTLTPQEIEKQKTIDDAYKAAIGKIPDKQKSVDPWGNIRPNPATAPKIKQGQQ